ncbi:hypothetical protein HDU76_006670 [Blyttiomyces sp. JEL0837]|nr:hypothetical protein HDU76_006670 [Blyttiomyces sp. JEL0837]
MTGLYTLHLQNNNLRGPIPDFFGNFTNLWDLDLSHNNFKDEIPLSMGNLSKLQNLILRDNPITGSLDALKPLKSLGFLDIGRTLISSPIPDWIGDTWTRLTSLYIYDTPVSGTLPQSLANLTYLETLGLWNNSITGKIPDLGSMERLKILRVHLNLLNGTVPESFQNVNFSDINVSGNCLVGSLPQGLIERGFQLGIQRDVCVKDLLPRTAGMDTTTRTPATSSSVSGSTATDPSEVTEIGTLFVTISPTPTPSVFQKEGGNNDNNGAIHMSTIFIVACVVAGCLCFAVIGFFAVFVWRRRGNWEAKKGDKKELPFKTEQLESTKKLPPLNMKTKDPSSPPNSPKKDPSSPLNSPIQLRTTSENYTPNISFYPIPQTMNAGSHPQTINIKTKESNSIRSGATNEDVDNSGQVDPSNLVQYQLLAEMRPVNVIELEQQLQQTYGSFMSWSHELVMEWTRLRNFESVVVEFLKAHHIDGPMLSDLSMSLLQDKYDVKQFRDRAKIMQAVEYLRHSRMVPLASRDSDLSMLPVYES